MNLIKTPAIGTMCPLTMKRTSRCEQVAMELNQTAVQGELVKSGHLVCLGMRSPVKRWDIGNAFIAIFLNFSYPGLPVTMPFMVSTMCFFKAPIFLATLYFSYHCYS